MLRPIIPPEVIENWAKVTSQTIEKHKANIREGRELAWVAVRNGQVLGFSALWPQHEELRAVYISKEAARQGIGSKLLGFIEKKAKDLGLSQIKMHSSLTAKKFYEIHGYENLGEGLHTLSSGIQMAFVSMRKKL